MDQERMKFCPGDLVKLADRWSQWTYTQPFETFRDLAIATLARSYGVVYPDEIVLVISTPEKRIGSETWVCIIDTNGCVGYIREFLIRHV